MSDSRYIVVAVLDPSSNRSHLCALAVASVPNDAMSSATIIKRYLMGFEFCRC